MDVENDNEMETDSDSDSDEEFEQEVNPLVIPPDFQRIGEGLNSQDENLKLLAVKQLKNFIEADLRIVDVVFNDGLLPRLVDCLDSENTEMLASALWILIQITKHLEDEPKVTIVRAGAIPKLANLSTSNDQNVAEQALSTILYVGPGISRTEFKNMVLQNNVLVHVKELIQKPCSLEALQCASGLMTALCWIGLYDNEIDEYLSSYLEIISLAMEQADSMVKLYCLYAIKHLINTKSCTVQSIINQGFLAKFPKLILTGAGGDADVHIPIAIGVLKTLTSYSTDVNQVKSILTYSNTVQASDNLEALRDLLQSNMNVNDWLGLKLKQNILKYLKNLSQKESDEFLQQIIDVNLIPIVLGTIKVVMATVQRNGLNSTIDLQRNGICIINNLACYGNIAQIEYLLTCDDLISTICQILNTTKDTELLQLSLVLLTNILEAISSMNIPIEEVQVKKKKLFDLIAASKGCWELIEKMQTDKNIGISEPAKELLTEYMEIVKANICMGSSPVENTTATTDDSDCPRVYFHCSRGPAY